MTRSHHLKKEVSKHAHSIYSNTKESKKNGYGTGNWGGNGSEIAEGIDIVQRGEMGRGTATAQDLGMSKLSTSASSDTSSSSFSSHHSSASSDA